MTTEETLQTTHIPVLLESILAHVRIGLGDTILDATAGGGGYSRAVGKQLGKSGMLIALDADHTACERVRIALEGLACTVHIVEENFRHVGRVLDRLEVPLLNLALFDLGLSNDLIESSGRGFSFLRDEPLVMTFASVLGGEQVTARDVVNDWPLDTLITIFQGYGEERNAKKIAHALVRAREERPIETTRELAEIIEEAVPRRGKRMHPATKTFQAIRIAVNDEYTALEEGLHKAFTRLAPGGKLCVVSFQSGEDRIVKRTFRDWSRDGSGIRITKKPITPNETETDRNPKSRSAKLRIIEKADL